GRRLVSLTDEGNRLDAHLVYGPDGNLSGITNTEIFTLTGPGGIPLIDKSMADAESMAPGVDGEIIVAFERIHRLWAYPPNQTEPIPLPLPAEMKNAPDNGGIEALTLLDDGSLFAIAEGKGRGGTYLAWVSNPKGWSVLIYRTEDNYRPTGAATLPGGDVVVLERYFTPREGARSRVRRIKADGIRAGAEVSGELLADIRAPLTVDNFEGIEAIKGPKGETLLFLISDNNFNRFGPQRTLLMVFELQKK
ncbi:MAG: esterase-like activity of phytase family protein, partial [Alphaproteobacteria bacterium]